MRHQPDHQHVPRKFSYELSSGLSIRWQKRWLSHYVIRSSRIDELVPSLVVYIGIRILIPPITRDVFRHTAVENLHVWCCCLPMSSLCTSSEFVLLCINIGLTSWSLNFPAISSLCCT